MSLETMILLTGFFENIRDRLPGITLFFGVFSVPLFIILIVNLYDGDAKEIFMKVVTRTLISFVTLCLLGNFLLIILPTPKTMYTIMGISVSRTVIDSEIGKRTTELILKKIESYLGETTK